MPHFTYRLRHGGKTVRIGKGTVATQSVEAVEAYFRKRGYSHFGSFDLQWHSSESAAFKEESRAIAGYTRARGRLPSRNDRQGGGGGRSGNRTCKEIKADGTRCQNAALQGNYGFCGVHR